MIDSSLFMAEPFLEKKRNQTDPTITADRLGARQYDSTLEPALIARSWARLRDERARTP
jgi:hypothetical protein